MSLEGRYVARRESDCEAQAARSGDPLDAETVAGIINLLMRIDARLEELLELLSEDDGEQEDDT